MDKINKAKENFFKGVKYFQENNFIKAEFYFEETLKDAPTSSPTLENLAKTYIQNKKFDEAQQKLEYFISLNKKDDAIAYTLLFDIYSKKNLNKKLDELIKKAFNSKKLSDELKIKKIFFYPYFFRSLEEIKIIRDKFENEIDYNINNENLPKLNLSEKILTPPNFALSYDGCDNLVLNKKLINFYKNIYPELKNNFEISEIKNEKIKIGFISEFFTDHTIMKLFKGLIYKLNKEKFEVYVFYSDKTLPGKSLDEIKENTAIYNYKNVFLPKNFNEKVSIIKNKNLDILFYTDIHISTNLYYLTLLRLAKKQITSWGHPETTGNDKIDYFLSSKLLETKNYKNRYSEQVLLSNYLPMFFYKPIVSNKLLKEDLSKKNIYSCPQTLIKIHPKFDKIIKKILEKDRKAKIFFIKDYDEIFSKLLFFRLKKILSNNIDRIIFINKLSTEDFINHCGRASVLLDPYWFGAGNSFHESMYYGTPTVSMPTEYLKSRIVTGAYKQMNIENPPIVKDEDEYVNKCIEIANSENLDLKMYYKNQAESNLFENIKFIDDAENILSSIVK